LLRKTRKSSFFYRTLEFNTVNGYLVPEHLRKARTNDTATSTVMTASNLSVSQQKVLAITPKVTSLLSIPCSIFIIFEAIRDSRRGKSSAVQRALVGMSCIDILSSSAWFLSTWAVPRGTIAYSVGNQATCNFQGFLLQLAIGAPLYNCSLALYYLLIIKYKWTNERLQKSERWVHVSIISFSVGSSVALLPLKLYNHIVTVCWVIGSPAGCENSSHIGSDIPCDRGNHAWLYGILLFYAPLWLCVALTVLVMAVIYLEVRATHVRMTRYSINAFSVSELETVERSRDRQKPVVQLQGRRKDVERVARQAILYSLSFGITWLPSTIWSIATWFNVDSFWLDFASAFCEPLQGFWNFLVFIQHRPSSKAAVRRCFHRLCCCWLGTERDLSQAHPSCMNSTGVSYSVEHAVADGIRSSIASGFEVDETVLDEGIGHEPHSNSALSSTRTVSVVVTCTEDCGLSPATDVIVPDLGGGAGTAFALGRVHTF
jgi:hypothetical protein